MKRQFTKYSIFNLVVFLITILIGQIACQRAERRSDIDNIAMESSSDRNIVDSIFQADFAILDSALKQKHTTGYYSLYRVNEVTDFLVSLSGIEPTVDMSYIGWMGVNQGDVLKWKEWYAQNKHRLKWDEEKQEVVLEPDNDTHEQAESSQKVDSVFQRHFLVLDNFLKGNPVYNDTVNQAIDFFESLTKIQSSAAYTPYGRFQVTESEVEAWKQWYKDNHDKLKWDEEKRKVILAPTKSSLKNKENIETLIQKAIDYDGLQLYLHPEVTGTETLSITGASIPGDLKLYKFGRPVRNVSPDSQTENCLIFNEIEIGSDKAHLSFEYNIEGVRCDLVFALRESGWSIIEDKLIEK